MSERLRRWLEEAAADVTRGMWAEENVWALTGRRYTPGQAWEDARECFRELIDRLESVDVPLVARMLLHLEAIDRLDTTIPDLDRLEELMSRSYPPSLLIHPQAFQRTYNEYEWYQVPVEARPFLGADGRELAQTALVTYRDRWDREENGPFRRYLLFERVQPDRLDG